MIAKKCKLPGGVMTLTHTQHYSRLRIVSEDGKADYLRDYAWDEAVKAERDYDAIRIAAGEVGTDAEVTSSASA